MCLLKLGLILKLDLKHQYVSKHIHPDNNQREIQFTVYFSCFDAKNNYKKTPMASIVLLTGLPITTIQWCHMLPPMNGISIFSPSQNHLEAKKFPIR